MLDAVLTFDTRVFLFINVALANPLLDRLFPIITHSRFWLLPALVAVVFYLRREKGRALSVLALALLLAALSDPFSVRVLKPLFGRLRPCDPHAPVEGARFLVARLSSWSFPSAHAFNIFAQAAFWTFLYRRHAWAYLSFAAVIAVTRVYIGVHYPLDIAAGAAGGFLLGWGFMRVARKIPVTFFRQAFEPSDPGKKRVS